MTDTTDQNSLACRNNTYCTYTGGDDGEGAFIFNVQLRDIN